MGRQLLSRQHYRELADSTEPGPIKELLYLANGEATHEEKLRQLKKLYYEMVHSGGVWALRARSIVTPLSTVGRRVTWR